MMQNIPSSNVSPGSFRAFIIGILIVIPWQISFSQLAGQFYPSANLSNFPFTLMAYGPDNQLPQSEIKSIIKNPATGELFFSTSNGVVIFNGYEMLPFSNEPVYSELNYSKLCYHWQYPHPLGFNDGGELFLLDLQPKLIGRYGAVDIRENLWAVIDSTGIIQFVDTKKNAKTVVETGIAYPTFLRYMGKGSILISDRTHTYLFSLSTQIKEILLRDMVVAAKSDAELNKTYLLSRSKLYVYGQTGISEIYLSDNKNIL
jgi:hypothetical protein